MNRGKGWKKKKVYCDLLALTYIVELTNLVPLGKTKKKKRKKRVFSRLCLIITYIIAQETQ